MCQKRNTSIHTFQGTSPFFWKHDIPNHTNTPKRSWRRQVHNQTSYLRKILDLPAPLAEALMFQCVWIRHQQTPVIFPNSEDSLIERNYFNPYIFILYEPFSVQLGGPIKLDTIKSGLSIVYIDWSHVIISKKLYFFLWRLILFHEMPHDVSFHLGLHCLPKYKFRGF